MPRLTMNDLSTCHAHILNVGLGVQSTATALMIINGVIPRPDAFVFADTGWERPGTYENLERMIPLSEEAGIPFHVLKVSNIRDSQLRDDISGVDIPVYVNASRWEDVEGHWDLLKFDLTRLYNKEKKADTLFSQSLEEILQNARREFDQKVKDGVIKPKLMKLDTGQVGRQCTYNYKIHPIQKWCRQNLGAHFKRPVGQWLGISTDELTRMTTSRTKAFKLFYPLIDLRLSRDDCLAYLEDIGYPTPVRSSCVGCPFRSNASWEELSPEEIEDAAEFEEALNEIVANSKLLKDRPYFANGVHLHASKQPIRTKPWKKPEYQTDQLSLDEDLCDAGGGCFL